MRKLFGFVLAGFALWAVTCASHAAALYVNGPYDGQNAATPLYTGATADSFLLGTASTVTGVNFLEWCGPGENPISVDWAILDGVPGTGNVLASGTAAGGDTFLYLNSQFYGVYSVSFAITPLNLAAGTYWLELQNALVTDFGVGFWDINGGPSQAWNSVDGDITSCNAHPSGRCSHSFAIFGRPTGVVPEASSRDLAIAALIVLTVFIPGHRKKTAGRASAMP